MRMGLKDLLTDADFMQNRTQALELANQRLKADQAFAAGI
jgi:hypothetical protein